MANSVASPLAMNILSFEIETNNVSAALSKKLAGVWLRKLNQYSQFHISVSLFKSSSKRVTDNSPSLRGKKPKSRSPSERNLALIPKGSFKPRINSPCLVKYEMRPVLLAAI